MEQAQYKQLVASLEGLTVAHSLMNRSRPCASARQDRCTYGHLSVQKAFRWRHRFLAFLNRQKPSALAGIIEADETFFPVSCKGQRKAVPRTPKKRGGKGPWHVHSASGAALDGHRGDHHQDSWHVHSASGAALGPFRRSPVCPCCTGAP